VPSLAGRQVTFTVPSPAPLKPPKQPLQQQQLQAPQWAQPQAQVWKQVPSAQPAWPMPQQSGPEVYQDLSAYPQSLPPTSVSALTSRPGAWLQQQAWQL
jgi:hypothetical protein